nr:hypothetical protein [Tanacetum cinerariifolium]
MSKVYPAMYIQNVTELAFDDITPKDSEFSSIQNEARYLNFLDIYILRCAVACFGMNYFAIHISNGFRSSGLAEAGFISSKLSRYEKNPSDQDESLLNFCLERSTMSKVYPAMYIQNVTELAFDDITPKDSEFSSIQNEARYLNFLDIYILRCAVACFGMNYFAIHISNGFRSSGLAEAGFISSKLSRYEKNPSDQDESLLNFCLESRIKPVKKAQAAVAHASSEACDVVSEVLVGICPYHK